MFLIFMLFGCYIHENNKKIKIEEKSNKSVIYALSRGNYGIAFMLSHAYSSRADKVILAVGQKKWTYPIYYQSSNNTQYYTVESQIKLAGIEPLIDQYASVNTQLFISAVAIANGDELSCESLKKIKEINLVPEGTSIFEYKKEVIDKFIHFKNKVNNCGQAKVNLVLWDSIDINKLMGKDYPLSLLPKAGIDFNLINFDEMAKKIKQFNNGGAFIASAFYNTALVESYLEKPIFEKAKGFDKAKKSIAFLGGYSFYHQGAFINQKKLLEKLIKITDGKKYNLIYKAHPRDLRVNYWIEKDNKPISYFNLVPYEFWQVLGEGNYQFEYKNKTYEMYFPPKPHKIYGIFSTSFYSEAPGKLKEVFAYNKVSHNEILLPEKAKGAEEDKKEFIRFQYLTQNDEAKFSTTFNWLYPK